MPTNKLKIVIDAGGEAAVGTSVTFTKTKKSLIIDDALCVRKVEIEGEDLKRLRDLLIDGKVD